MSSPTDSRDQSDPGDEVIRKFRYQHAYGVVLAVLVLKQSRPYRAIWCEQHEDLLAERNDNLFEAFQVKTRKPETGAWNISDDAFVKSISRFIKLDSEYPGQITKFYFVSNAGFSASEAKKSIHLSPVKLMNAILVSQAPTDLSDPPLKGFALLRSLVGCDEAALFSLLQRLELVHGPTERAFEDEICQTHLPSLDHCEGLSAGSLAKILNALIARMELAASLRSNDPLRHCVGITASGEDDPYLHAKRVTANDIQLVLQDSLYMGVQYPEELATLSLDATRESRTVLKKKLEAGGLGAHFEVMRRMALTAQYALIDLGTRAGNGRKLQAQVENVVFLECDEAYLRAKTQSEIYGTLMLLDLQERLKRVATTEALKVDRQPYEVLVGVAGLLSDDCQVWWSEQFSLEDST
jgi:Spy/CpxP family protein refolding chaperone